MKTRMNKKIVVAIIGIAAIVCNVAAAAVAAVDDSSWRGGPSKEWFVNWDKALAEAKKTGKKLFVLNTGSDWCGWCKRLRANVLDQPEFAKFSRKNLVLLYLDSPRRDPLSKEQSKHNRQIAKSLKFGGGVPNVEIFSADGMRLGRIGGGGDGLDIYLDKLDKIISEDGEPIGGDRGKMLFSGGYAKLAAQIAEERAKLPPVTKNDFKAKLTGVAIGTRNNRRFDDLEFRSPESHLEVAADEIAVFRVEYDFPEGYLARVFVRGRGRLISHSSREYSGKGVAYGHLGLYDAKQSVKLNSINIGTNSEPELEDYPNGWMIATVPVDIEFKGDSAAADDEKDVASNAPAVSKSVAKGWTEDFEVAKKKAAKEGKLILMDFSGSDWCGWCKKMDEEVFAKDRFVREASKKFVLVMIDTPNDKTILSNLARRQNQELKETYSVRGFPTVVIVDPEGKEVKRHSGYRAGGPSGYIKYLRELTRGVKWPKKAK